MTNKELIKRFEEVFGTEPIYPIEALNWWLKVLNEEKHALIREFTGGIRCMSCGNPKDSDLSDMCSKCLAEN